MICAPLAWSKFFCSTPLRQQGTGRGSRQDPGGWAAEWHRQSFLLTVAEHSDPSVVLSILPLPRPLPCPLRQGVGTAGKQDRCTGIGKFPGKSGKKVQPASIATSWLSSPAPKQCQMKRFQIHRAWTMAPRLKGRDVVACSGNR